MNTKAATAVYNAKTNRHEVTFNRPDLKPFTYSVREQSEANELIRVWELTLNLGKIANLMKLWGYKP